jgi:hypothetical protein
VQDPTISGSHRSGEGRDRPRGYSAAEKRDELAPIWFAPDPPPGPDRAQQDIELAAISQRASRWAYDRLGAELVDARRSINDRYGSIVLKKSSDGRLA